MAYLQCLIVLYSLSIHAQSQIVHPITGFTTGSPNMYSSEATLFTGYQSSQNRIWVVGSDDEIWHYDLDTNSWTDVATLDGGTLDTVNSQCSIQYGETILYIEYPNVEQFVFSTGQKGSTLSVLQDRREAPCAALYGDYLLLTGGKITAADSATQAGETSSVFQIYNVATDVWSALGPNVGAETNSRGTHACAVLGDYLHVFGGTTCVPSCSLRATNWRIYVGDLANINAYSWSFVPYQSGSNTYFHRAVVDSVNNLIYLVGGRDSCCLGGAASTRIQVYDPSTNSMDFVSTANDLKSGRSSPGVILVNQVMYVFGGSDDNGNAINTWERSNALTFAPTKAPTSATTTDPTRAPTTKPSKSPVPAPTAAPTNIPTPSPTTIPSISPTPAPTDQPTINPTKSPSKFPSKTPTIPPTNYPTSEPSSDPSNAPSIEPTNNPSFNPTSDPTSDPTNEPTQPSTQPTSDPSRAPTVTPTDAPSLTPTPRPILDVIPTPKPTNMQHTATTVTAAVTVAETQNNATKNTDDTFGLLWAVIGVALLLVVVCLIIMIAVLCGVVRSNKKRKRTMPMMPVYANEGGAQMTFPASVSLSSHPMTPVGIPQTVPILSGAMYHSANLVNLQLQRIVSMSSDAGIAITPMTLREFPMSFNTVTATTATTQQNDNLEIYDDPLEFEGDNDEDNALYGKGDITTGGGDGNVVNVAGNDNDEYEYYEEEEEESDDGAEMYSPNLRSVTQGRGH